jgi:hypothetical protein
MKPKRDMHKTSCIPLVKGPALYETGRPFSGRYAVQTKIQPVSYTYIGNAGQEDR